MQYSRSWFHSKNTGTETPERLEDLGHEPSGIELELLQQASLMATRADDLRRRMSRGKPVKDEDLSRLANGAARILLRLRVKRNESGQPQESLRDYAARRKSGAA